MADCSRFGRFEIRFAERQLWVDGQPATLGARAFDLLTALVAHRERVVSKAELLELVWPGVVVEENNLQVQVSALRKVLGPEVIATVPGRGYQFTAAGAGPPNRSLAQAAGLPTERTRFIGRDRDLAQAAAALGTTRLLTLTGIGGTGKTRLALALAAREAANYADGVTFVDLAPLQSATGLWPSVATALGQPEVRDMSPAEAVLQRLSTCRILLLLDNCESLPDETAALAEAVLSRCPGVTLLTTSRQPMQVAGERLHQVPPLGLGDSDAPEALLLSDAGRLFIERALVARPDFVLTADNAPAVAQLCRRLDGIPLALELAAARMALLDVGQIVERLDQRFALLTAGRERPPRQQTLLEVVRWSWQQLNEGDQRLLARLSVFAGGWTLMAAGCVAGTDDEIALLDGLTRLVWASLVVVDTGTSGASRQHLLETVRQFAAERLAERGEVEVARSQHFQACLQLAKTVGAAVASGDMPARLRFDSEIENMRLAHAWCGETMERAADGLRLMGALRFSWIIAGRPREGARMTQEALNRLGVQPSTRERASELLSLARLSYFTGDYAGAQTALDECLLVSRDQGWRDLESQALVRMADLAWPHGDFEAAREMAAQAVAIERELAAAEPGYAMVTALNGWANCQRWCRNFSAAALAYEEALNISRRVDSPPSVANLLVNLVVTWLEGELPGQVQASLAEVVEIQSRTESPWVGKNLLRGCAAYALHKGDWRTGVYLDAAEEAWAKRWGFHHDQGRCVQAGLVQASAALGEYSAAQARAEGLGLAEVDALALAREWLAHPGQTELASRGTKV